MRFACPEIHQRSVAGCGNIVGAGSAAGVELSFERGDSAGGEFCARAPEAANEEAPSMPQSAKTKCKFECRIFNFQLPFRSAKVWLAIRIVQAKSRLMNA
jgi:hypothetical protein